MPCQPRLRKRNLRDSEDSAILDQLAQVPPLSPIRKSGARMLDVLIVDDSAAIRKILQRVLRQAEIPIGNVFEAGDGVEALSKLASQNVGLILSDINMPNMDGLELLSKVKANETWKDLPMVMVSIEGSQAKV